MTAAKQWTHKDVSHVVACADPLELIQIFDESINLCVWQRPPDGLLSGWLETLAAENSFEIIRRMTLAQWPPREISELAADQKMISLWLSDLRQLLELYQDLMGCESFGIRLHTLNEDMCPRFHVDRVGVRMLCTYAGPGTEWLMNENVDRTQLGPRGQVLRPGSSIQQLQPFEVGLLKGEAFPGNEGRGLVHRSPAIASAGKKRILFSVEANDSQM